MVTIDPGVLRRVPVFSSLADDALTSIAGRCTDSRFLENREIISHRSMDTDLFILLEGSVKVVSYSGGGREVFHRRIDAGEIFGEMSAIDGSGRAASVITLTPAHVARMSDTAFKALVAEKPEFALQIMTLLVEKLRAATDRVFDLSTKKVSERVRLELLRLVSDNLENSVSASIDPAPTHYELSTRVSTNREGVTRELNRLSAEGLVRVGKRNIEIFDVNALVRSIASDAV